MVEANVLVLVLQGKIEKKKETRFLHRRMANWVRKNRTRGEESGKEKKEWAANVFITISFVLHIPLHGKQPSILKQTSVHKNASADVNANASMGSFKGTKQNLHCNNVGIRYWCKRMGKKSINGERRVSGSEWTLAHWWAISQSFTIISVESI